MEKYKLTHVMSSKSKEGKVYYNAFLTVISDYGCDLIKCMITQKQFEELQNLVDEPQIDISKYLTVSYNNYTKSYKPAITYGL